MSVNFRTSGPERADWGSADIRSLQSPNDAQQIPATARSTILDFNFVVPEYRGLQNRSEIPRTSARITMMLDTSLMGRISRVTNCND
jgi:hypothetical protein